MSRKSALRLLFIFTPLLLACGWDWDTLKMERKAFPSVHEAIVGKFLRHSPELYQWRVRDRAALIEKHPDSLHFYNDLAMAYDKTGRSRQAVEVMLLKEKRSPGLYETYSNLGLFYMHLGDLDSGCYYVRKALKINSNAHFGREKYQLHLGEYIISKTRDGQLQLPMGTAKNDFFDFLNRKVFEQAVENSSTLDDELSKAIKGVAGMMHFANYRSPVLLEVLGDLLLKTDKHGGAGHLASRAYLKAAFESSDEVIKAAYTKKASLARERVREMDHSGMLHYGENVSNNPLYTMENLTYALKLEVQSAGQWFDSIRHNEINWIKSGLNPDSMFALTYYDKMPVQARYYDNYYTNAKFDAKMIDESWWLTQQFSDSGFIRGIHAHAIIPDSVQRWLDSIYGFELDYLSEDFNHRQEASQDFEPARAYFPNYVWGLIILVGISAITVVIYFARRKNEH
ncbi:MAG: tetratricopeptide repeat protein [Flavobacteriales bacterium]